MFNGVCMISSLNVFLVVDGFDVYRIVHVVLCVFMRIQFQCVACLLN